MVGTSTHLEFVKFFDRNQPAQSEHVQIADNDWMESFSFGMLMNGVFAGRRKGKR